MKINHLTTRSDPRRHRHWMYQVLKDQRASAKSSRPEIKVEEYEMARGLVRAIKQNCYSVRKCFREQV